MRPETDATLNLDSSRRSVGNVETTSIQISVEPDPTRAFISAFIPLVSGISHDDLPARTRPFRLARATFRSRAALVCGIYCLTSRTRREHVRHVCASVRLSTHPITPRRSGAVQLRLRRRSRISGRRRAIQPSSRKSPMSSLN